LSAKLLLAGYFGCGNLGDDAILMGLSQGLKDEDVEMVLLSGSPDETYRQYGIRSAPRKDIKVIDEEIKRCDVLVFPGGSIFQDVTSVKSPAYYSTLVTKAKKAGKRVVFLAQGVGPLTSFFGKRFAVTAFKAADDIVVRDPGSLQTLRDLGIKTPVQVAADLAFLMPPPIERPDSQSFAVGNMKTVGIAPRPFGKHTKTIIQLFGDLARMLYQSGQMPVLIEMDHNDDRNLIAEIGKTQGGKVPDIRKLQTPMQVQERMARMDAVIAMRLHAGILATTVGVPSFMVSYDPKVAAFAKLLELSTAPNIEGLTAQRLFESFQQFQKDRERNEKILERKREEFRKLAELNIEVLKRSLKSKVNS
jgi:polysaccharide pyruvyl transferase CsaB